MFIYKMSQNIQIYMMEYCGVIVLKHSLQCISSMQVSAPGAWPAYLHLQELHVSAPGAWLDFAGF